MNTPTPSPYATDGQRTADAECWMNYCLEAEKELTAAREELRISEGCAERWATRCLESRGNLKTATEQRDRMAEALENCREDSIELLGERDWWQLENRGDYQQRYQTTRDNVTHADAALQSLDQNVQSPPTGGNEARKPITS